MIAAEPHVVNDYSYGYDYGAVDGPTSPTDLTPKARAMIEAYTKGIDAASEQSTSHYGPPVSDQPRQGPSLVDLEDPIQVHLLTETALSDSKEYEILSQEDVDALKKQIQSLTQRLEQARANLAIQSKYRDAAMSMTKLYPPTAHNIQGDRGSSADDANEAELEKQLSERRCEELAVELFSLEKRVMEPQRRLLQHTAGILQMTHRASAAKSTKQPLSAHHLLHGIPGSPESLYTSSNGRNSMDAAAEGMYFDDRSLYFPLEPFDAQPQKTPAEVSVKAPVREEHNQLRAETDHLRDEADRLSEERDRLREERDRLHEERDRLREEADGLLEETGHLREQTDQLHEEANQSREETDRLRRETDRLNEENHRSQEENVRLNGEVESLRGAEADLARSITNAEKKLESLTANLHSTVSRLNPTRRDPLGPPARLGDEPKAPPSAMFSEHLDYLEKGMAAVLDEWELALSGKQEQDRVTPAATTETVNHAEGRIVALNNQLYSLLQDAEPDHPPPPKASGTDSDEQIDYLQASLGTVQAELSRLAELSSSNAEYERQSEQVQTVLAGLWDIIQTGDAERHQQKAERRRARAEMGLKEDEDDMSGDESMANVHEPYSVQAFSTKIQRLYAQSTSLKEQKIVLKRQIKQQRELNNKSSSEKDAELSQRMEELQSVRELLHSTQREAKDVQERLTQALSDLDILHEANAGNEIAAAQTAQDQIKEGNAKVASLESTVQDLQDRLSKTEASAAATEAQLAEASAAKEAAEAEAEMLRAEVRRKHEELERMNEMVIEMKTQATVARAELEGAYGSRAERAAEAAALTKTSEILELAAHIDKLKGELAKVVRELEDMTKEAIAAEKEKAELESKLDDVSASKASLVAEFGALKEKLDRDVARLHEQLDAERLRLPPDPNGPAPKARTGAAVLSEQFRAHMKDQRKKFQEDLREEQARRRKLEDELRALRKSLGPGKSPLSPLGVPPN